MGGRIVASLITTLELRDTVSDEERDALEGLSWTIKQYPSGAEIIAEGSRPSQSCLLISGMAARCLWLDDGARGLAALHIRGDFVDLHGLFLRIMDHSIIALTDCQVAFVAHADLRDVIKRLPHLGRLLTMLIAIDAAVERQWIVGLSRRQADSRLAHFFCELHARLKVVDAASENAFEFPLSQAVLADLTGLSLVHTNRTIQYLRSAGLIQWQEGTITIPNPDALAELAEFDPLYLNHFREPR